MKITFENTYTHLPGHFYQKISPQPVKHPQLVIYNDALAQEMGMTRDPEDTDLELAQYFSGHKMLPGASPIALAYAGHQFGYFVPQLGDGRALLLGEIIALNGERFDLQLKGSGRTCYSRGGDGQAALGPMLREYIVSEAMHALGIKTTRSLAVVTTGEAVMRERPLPGAILTRIASSHIRIGTFEYFAAQDDLESVKILLEYSIKRHYPHLLDKQACYLSFLKEVFERQAELIVNWLSAGFIHGVMNTDNMTISGETIDYGPCAFLDEYVPHKTFSSIDQMGRYAFNNQANVGLWNLMRLYEAVEKIIVKDLDESLALKAELEEHYSTFFNRTYKEKMAQKIGFFEEKTPQSEFFIEQLFKIMAAHQLDYTLTFRYLSHVIAPNSFRLEEFFQPPPALMDWVQTWRTCLQQDNLIFEDISAKMKAINPAIIPRNHQIEKALHAATFENDFSAVNQLMTALSHPYQEDLQFNSFMQAPQPFERVIQTFCGT